MELLSGNLHTVEIRKIEKMEDRSRLTLIIHVSIHI